MYIYYPDVWLRAACYKETSIFIVRCIHIINLSVYRNVNIGTWPPRVAGEEDNPAARERADWGWVAVGRVAFFSAVMLSHSPYKSCNDNEQAKARQV